MHRRGQYIFQPSGYKAFISKPLPPVPPIIPDESLNHLLSNANIALGRLDTVGYLLPNIDYIIAMYIRKDALLKTLNLLAKL